MFEEGCIIVFERMRVKVDAVRHLCYRDAATWISSSLGWRDGQRRRKPLLRKLGLAAKMRVMYVMRFRGSREVPPYFVGM